MKELPKKYDHKIAEKKWQNHWNEKQTYRWDDSVSREDSYVIDTPPPTVSGLLHMGHIFSYTQADFIARFQRMYGKNVFYPMGFDDNGLPTERLVEKVKKIRAVDLSREAFIAECKSVSSEARKDFRELFESIALSVDWNQEYHTVSEESLRISQLSFLDLFHKEDAYRKLQPMLWDPVDQTAIAQAEVEDKEKDSFENYINFGLVDAANAESATKPAWSDLEKVEIMTTRPELLPACVALMCHPDDADKYEGKLAVTPLYNVIVPIVTDEKVNKEKGTGLVMCCTFGDETDIEWWQTHNLETRVILNKFGKIDKFDNLSFYSEKACFSLSELKNQFTKIENKKVSNPNKDKEGNFLGARETIIQLLEENNELNSQKKISHAVKCAERSGAALEFIPTYQWFIKILDKKEELKEKAEECNWYPQYMKVRIDQWIDGLSWDWCISRQRYFGVPFPIWYSKRAGEEGKIIVADASQLPINPLVDLPKGYTKNEVIPETDVMDTWATSSISPQLNSKAITQEYAINYDRHQKLFPADLRPQAHEIIRTWAFYTIAKAHLHEDTIPWKNLMISGWCLASDKTKMSKSKGNVVTPVGLIEEKGSDVVRYWASTSHLGTDTAYSEDVLKIGKKLTNKLWNATKFASIQLDKLDGEPDTVVNDVKEGYITETIDLWIVSRLANAIDKATHAFQRYEYCRAREAIEDFFWNDFCDNYLEIVKVRSYGEDDKFTSQQQQSALYTLYHCVENILKLFAPFIPHITEELYSYIFDKKFENMSSIHQKGSWPKRLDCFYDENAERVGIACVDILDAVRKLKADKNVSIKWPLDNLYISKGSSHYEGWDQIDSIIDDLASVTNTKEVTWAESVPFDVDNCATENDVFHIAVCFSDESDAA